MTALLCLWSALFETASSQISLLLFLIGIAAVVVMILIDDDDLPGPRLCRVAAR